VTALVYEGGNLFAYKISMRAESSYFRFWFWPNFKSLACHSASTCQMSSKSNQPHHSTVELTSCRFSRWRP